MNSKTSAELKETGKEKSRPRKKRFRILPALLVLILLIGASVFFYTSYTKTHYRIKKHITGSISIRKHPKR